MKRVLVPALAMMLFMVFFGCTVTKANFDQSNHVFFERTVDNLQLGKAITKEIPHGKRIAIRSLEQESTVDRPVIAILEDQMVQALLNAGYSVVERDDNALSHLFKESNSNKFNIPKNKYAWLSGKDLKVETQNIPEGSDLDFIQTNLVAADYILAYRIQECGIRYEKKENSTDTILRNGLVRLHVRVYDAKTSEVKYVGNITGTNEDEIEKSMMYLLANFHYTNFFPYDYPLQYGKVASRIEVSAPVVKRKFYFRPMLAMINSDKVEGTGFDFGIGYYAGDNNRYYLNLISVPESEEEGSYQFGSINYGRRFKVAQFNVIPAVGLGYAGVGWKEEYYYSSWYGGHTYEDNYSDDGFGFKLGCTAEYPFLNKHTVTLGLNLVRSQASTKLNSSVMSIGYNF